MQKLTIGNVAFQPILLGTVGSINDFDAYQEWTGETAVYGLSIDKMLYDAGVTEESFPKVSALLRLMYAALGLGESGEVQGKVKKILRDSNGVITPEVTSALSKELGDQLYYLARMATELGLSLGDIARENQEKLMSRMERGVIQGSGDNR